MKAVAMRTAGCALSVLVACSPTHTPVPPEDPTACSPTYFKATTDEAAVVSVGAVLIGCKQDLGALTDSERELVHDALSEVAGELYFGVLACGELGVRARIAAHINKRLGRSIISDIFCYEASVADYIGE